MKTPIENVDAYGIPEKSLVGKIGPINVYVDPALEPHEIRFVFDTPVETFTNKIDFGDKLSAKIIIDIFEGATASSKDTYESVTVLSGTLSSCAELLRKLTNQPK